MKALVPWLWLGFRMTVRAGRAALVRSLLLGAATAIGCTLLLGALAVPGVVETQELKQAFRNPVVSDDALADGTKSLRGMTIDDGIGDRPLLRVALAGTDPSFPLPPGVGTLPAPGEAVVSPALARRIETDPMARQRFPQRIVGLIAPAGLKAPDEFVAYVGVEGSELPDGAYISGFGTPSSLANEGGYGAALGRSTIEQLLTPGIVVTFAFALFMFVPLGIMLSICSRLAARVRDQRLAALRLLGATRRQAQLTNAVEIGLITGIGAVAGYCFFRVLAAMSEGWSVGRFQWYAADLTIGPLSAIVIVLGLTAFAVAVSSAGVVASVRDPLHVKRDGAVKATGWWRGAVFGGAVFALAAAGLLPKPVGSLHLVLLASGMLGSVLLLPTALPLLLRFLAAPVISSLRAPIWLGLTARRVRHSPGIAPRLVSALVVSFFVAGAGMLAAGSYGSAADPGRDAENVARYQLSGTPLSFIPSLRNLPGVMSVAMYERHLAHDGDQVLNVLYAGCADLKVLFGRVGKCVDGTVLRVTDSAAVAGREVTMTHLNTGLPLPSLKIPAGELLLDEPRFRETADVVVTSAPDDPTVVFQARPANNEGLFAAISGAGPVSRVWGPRYLPGGFDVGAVLTLVAAGLLISMSMGMAAFAIAAIDRSVESRRQNAGLLAIGTPRWVLSVAEAAQSLASLVAGLVLAGGLLLLTAWSWTSLAGSGLAALLTPALPAITVAGAGLLVSVPVVAVAAVLSSRLRPDLLRRD